MKKNYYYKTTIWYCPLCGKEDKFRERIYAKKPKDISKRIIIQEVYDYCDI